MRRPRALQSPPSVLLRWQFRLLSFSPSPLIIAALSLPFVLLPLWDKSAAVHLLTDDGLSLRSPLPHTNSNRVLEIPRREINWTHVFAVTLVRAGWETDASSSPEVKNM